MSDLREAPQRVSAPSIGNSVDLLAGVHIRLSVEVGATTMTLAQLAMLDTGSVITLDRLVDEPLDICANGSRIARGEIVSVDGRYGVRITELVSNAASTAGLGMPL